MADETLTVAQRWERGVEHDPRSVELAKDLAAIDFEQCGDYFCWKFGGDGDNGETLLYELDVYFARRTPEAGSGPRPLTDAERVALDATVASSLASSHAAGLHFSRPESGCPTCEAKAPVSRPVQESAAPGLCGCGHPFAYHARSGCVGTEGAPCGCTGGTPTTKREG